MPYKSSLSKQTNKTFFFSSLQIPVKSADSASSSKAASDISHLVRKKVRSTNLSADLSEANQNVAVFQWAEWSQQLIDSLRNKDLRTVAIIICMLKWAMYCSLSFMVCVLACFGCRDAVAV